MRRFGPSPRSWRHSTTPDAIGRAKRPRAHGTSGGARHYRTEADLRSIRNHGTGGSRADVHSERSVADGTTSLEGT